MSWIEYLWKWLLTASPTPIRVTEITMLFLALASLAINQLRPDWGQKMTRLAWELPLALLVVVFIASLVVSSYHLYQKQQQTIDDLQNQLEIAKKQAYPSVAALMLNNNFENVDVPLGEFGLVDQVLAHKTFKNCRVVGPAVVVVGDRTNIIGNTLEGPLQGVFIVTTNDEVWGVIKLEDVTFINCRFTKVSFIGNQAAIDNLKAGFGVQ